MSRKPTHGSLGLSFAIGLLIVYHVSYHPPAWIQGGRVGGGSGDYIEVKESDLARFPHLLEAFREDEEAGERHRAHAQQMTWCPRGEALRLIEFLGGERPRVGRTYGYGIQIEDGTKYSFGIVFVWEPPGIQ